MATKWFPRSDPDYVHVERRIACWKSRLRGQLQFTAEDCEDAAQEIILVLVLRLPTFDARRASRPTFISRIIDSQAKTIIEARRAAKRDPKEIAHSLDEPIRDGDEDAQLPFEILSTDEYRRAISGPQLSEEERLELGIDLWPIVSELSEFHKQICKRLANGDPIMRIAAELKLSRSAIYAHKERIARRFGVAGYGPVKDSARHFGRRPSK